MNFDDTPEEAAFRAEVRAWIDANAPKELLSDVESSGFGSLTLAGVDPMAAAQAGVGPEGGRQGLTEEEVRRWLGLPALAEGIRRPRRHAHRARDLGPGGRTLRRTGRHLHHRSRHVRPHHDGVRVRGAEAALFAAVGRGRGDLVP